MTLHQQALLPSCVRACIFVESISLFRSFCFPCYYHYHYLHQFHSFVLCFVDSIPLFSSWPAPDRHTPKDPETGSKIPREFPQRRRLDSRLGNIPHIPDLPRIRIELIETDPLDRVRRIHEGNLPGKTARIDTVIDPLGPEFDAGEGEVLDEFADLLGPPEQIVVIEIAVDDGVVEHPHALVDAAALDGVEEVIDDGAGCGRGLLFVLLGGFGFGSVCEGFEEFEGEIAGFIDGFRYFSDVFNLALIVESDKGGSPQSLLLYILIDIRPGEPTGRRSIGYLVDPQIGPSTICVCVCVCVCVSQGFCLGYHVLSNRCDTDDGLGHKTILVHGVDGNRITEGFGTRYGRITPFIDDERTDDFLCVFDCRRGEVCGASSASGRGSGGGSGATNDW
mmetsp:Transcript_36322/g.51370  ORF Transcript_36322/g.51370 Transcript_36322/m.51370 type:complete len:392 (-) Transcript_36322:34-1209(-)